MVGPSDAETPTAAQVAQVKEILIAFANAVSAAKLFPPEHPSVLSFISELHTKLKGYLDRNWKLELGVEEQNFTLDGKIVYHDPQPVKSLPFLFFKDGMQTLYFYRGLELEELKGFLETIRQVSQLPPEEGDIVSALWERDFPNIRYYVPDDFLETRIGGGKPPLEIRVEREEFSRGRIELDPEDLEKIRTAALTSSGSGILSSKEAFQPVPEELNLILTPGDEKELKELESLLLDRRKVSSEEEYQSLVLELLCLEQRTEELMRLTTVLQELLRKAVQKRNWQSAAQLLTSLHELQESLFEKDKKKAEFAETTIQKLSQESLSADFLDSLDLNQVQDPHAFLDYLRLTGPQSGRLVATIFEQSADSSIRQKALQILEEMGKREGFTLMTLAQDSKPSLTKEIIRLVGRLREKKAIPYLAGFISSRNREIKLEAIKALGGTANEAADKILLGFLNDEDEGVRIAALQNLSSVSQFILKHLLGLMRGKEFKKKSLAEIRAFFEAVARSGSNEGCLALKGYLRERIWWVSRRKTDVALQAIAALKDMPIPEAREVLNKAAQSKSKKIKRACLEILSSPTPEIPDRDEQGTDERSSGQGE